MRKFIINNWFGVFRFKNGFMIEKAAIMNFSILGAAAIPFLLLENEALGSLIAGIAGAIVFLTTFVYLRYWPVSWHELNTDLQKWYYGKYWVDFVQDKMPWPQEFIDNLDYWRKLDEKYRKQ